jgi:hypothetical protein
MERHAGENGAMLDVIGTLEATPGALANIVLEASEADLDRAAAGEWSARTVLAHVRDYEHLVMRMRVARMVAEDAPVFPDFDETRWEAARNRGRDRKEQLLADLALQRRASLDLLRSLGPGDWHRTGTHEAGKRWTVESWVSHWAEHDRLHIEQLERALGVTLEEVVARRARPDEGAEG